jgi:hypothetical protein
LFSFVSRGKKSVSTRERDRAVFAYQKKMAALRRQQTASETLLGSLLDAAPHRADEDDIGWWCLRVSPRPTAETVAILRCFIRFLRTTLSLFLKETTARDGVQEYEETIRSTILVLELVVDEPHPDISYLGWFSGSSVFRSIDLRRPSAQKRSGCNGFLVLARRDGRHLMSMTVWERVMIRLSDRKKIVVQEHALIVKNPLLAPQQNVRGLAMRMHSFAADSIRKEIVVCSPYRAMAIILERYLENETIDRAEYLERGFDDPCKAFGSAYRIVNNEKLRSLWRIGGTGRIKNFIASFS